MVEEDGLASFLGTLCLTPCSGKSLTLQVPSASWHMVSGLQCSWVWLMTRRQWGEWLRLCCGAAESVLRLCHLWGFCFWVPVFIKFLLSCGHRAEFFLECPCIVLVCLWKSFFMKRQVFPLGNEMSNISTYLSCCRHVYCFLWNLIALFLDQLFFSHCISYKLKTWSLRRQKQWRKWKVSVLPSLRITI